MLSQLDDNTLYARRSSQISDCRFYYVTIIYGKERAQKDGRAAKGTIETILKT